LFIVLLVVYIVEFPLYTFVLYRYPAFVNKLLNRDTGLCITQTPHWLAELHHIIYQPTFTK